MPQPLSAVQCRVLCSVFVLAGLLCARFCVCVCCVAGAGTRAHIVKNHFYLLCTVPSPTPNETREVGPACMLVCGAAREARCDGFTCRVRGATGYGPTGHTALSRMCATVSIVGVDLSGLLPRPLFGEDAAPA